MNFHTIYFIINLYIVNYISQWLLAQITLFLSDLEQQSNPTHYVLNTVDGLLPVVDDVQNRLQQLNLEHKVNLINDENYNQYWLLLLSLILD